MFSLVGVPPHKLNVFELAKCVIIKHNICMNIHGISLMSGKVCYNSRVP